jgi:DNA-binding NarL/FixJ family response regulator
MRRHAEAALPRDLPGVCNVDTVSTFGRTAPKSLSGSVSLRSLGQGRALSGGATLDALMALEDAARSAAAAAERALALAEVLDEELAVLARARNNRENAAPASPLAVAELSPREREVLALVAEGCSNKAIAEALFVSPNTVKTHVTSLLNKLNAERRVQLASIAARQGLR